MLIARSLCIPQHLGSHLQRFCKEAITWKTLRHPNVLPLIGVAMTETKFSMISDWMVNGNINEFVKENPNADRLKLASPSLFAPSSLVIR